MKDKLFEEFYGKNNCLEVCVILFDKCNLNCEFCFEEHTHIISQEEILNIIKSLLDQLDEEITQKPWLNEFVFRIWGGEVFGDFVPDEYFKTYQEILNMIKAWAKINNYKVSFCFSTNLVFFHTDRVKQFIENNKKDTYIATSYDPIGRFGTKLLEDLWWKNLKIFNPEVISITLTKPNIDKYINSDILQKLSDYTIYPEYYIYNKDWEKYAPSGQDVFNFYKYVYENNINNIPEIIAIINSYNNPSGRYCYCRNSCSMINGKLVFSCLLRSGTLSMINDYGMTLEECYDNKNVTKKQFYIAVDNLKCFQCKYYSFCRLPCMASQMHKNSDKICQLKLFYDWIGEHK